MKSKRNMVIDSAKGIAVLMVFIVHCFPSVYPYWGKYFAYGQYGVELFLICSGYTAMLGVNMRNDIGNPIVYLAKKAIRILPVFWVYVLVVWIVNSLPFLHIFAERTNLIYSSTPDVMTLVSSLFLFNYLNPKWGYFSLFTCVYSLVNILFVVFILPLNKKKKARNFLIFVLLMGINSLLPRIQTFFSVVETYYFLQYMVRGICAFSAGILLYEILNVQLLMSLIVNKEIYYVLTIGSLFLMISSCYYSDYWNSSIFIVYAVVFLMIFHGLVLLGGKLFVGNRVLQFIGKYSWSFYFTHSPVFYWFKGYLDGSVLLIASFICSLMISLLITKLYEKPLTKFLYKIFFKKNL